MALLVLEDIIFLYSTLLIHPPLLWQSLGIVGTYFSVTVLYGGF